MWSNACEILKKLEFSRQILEKYSNIKFHENPSNWEQSFSMRTDRQTDMTKLIVTFRNFAQATADTHIKSQNAIQNTILVQFFLSFLVRNFSLKNSSLWIKIDDLSPYNDVLCQKTQFGNIVYGPYTVSCANNASIYSIRERQLLFWLAC